MIQPISLLRSWLVSEISTHGVSLPRWGPAGLGWSQRCVGDVIVVCLAGELDLSTAVELRQQLRAVTESDSAATIVLDLSDVRFIDAGSVGLIMSAWAAAKVRGRVLQVFGLRGLPARVFGMLGLEPMLVRPVAR